MKEALLVFAGGGLGSLCRFYTGKIVNPLTPDFPLGTLLSNFLSCVIFGIVIVISVDKLAISNTLKLLLITGFCGGFSTYSSFTYETIQLFKNGNTGIALANIFLNFFLSVSGLYLGIFSGKNLTEYLWR